MPDNLADALILITREGMGSGPLELQRKLLGNFLALLEQNADLPAAIAFYTEGVKLLTADSPLLDQLRLLESRGIPLIACKTCIDSYQIANQLAVGIVGGMGDILAAMTRAGRVITI
jgi:intracellular sulfur oxidation DsrE/DsrF family protein